MITDANAETMSNVEPISTPSQSHALLDELGRMTDMLRNAMPAEAEISFEYDGELRLHVDVRDYEDMAQVEALLPSLFGGIFSDVQPGWSTTIASSTG